MDNQVQEATERKKFAVDIWFLLKLVFVPIFYACLPIILHVRLGLPINLASEAIWVVSVSAITIVCSEVINKIIKPLNKCDESNFPKTLAVLALDVVLGVCIFAFFMYISMVLGPLLPPGADEDAFSRHQLTVMALLSGVFLQIRPFLRDTKSPI